jgi:peptidoglycan hydrolase-like protein with peptidoglycan-binding domain
MTRSDGIMQIEFFEANAVLILVKGEVSVLELQGRLRDLGYYDGPLETQPWRETLMALKKFQNDHGLPVTGCPDPATMAALRESYCY